MCAAINTLGFSRRCGFVDVFFVGGVSSSSKVHCDKLVQMEKRRRRVRQRMTVNDVPSKVRYRLFNPQDSWRRWLGLAHVVLFQGLTVKYRFCLADQVAAFCSDNEQSSDFRGRDATFECSFEASQQSRAVPGQCRGQSEAGESERDNGRMPAPSALAFGMSVLDM